MQMKREGKYLVRSLSFKGASFDVEEVELTKAQEAVWDGSAELWEQQERTRGGIGGGAGAGGAGVGL